ncbi:MAG: DPP IV N-terminal domain-containing protein [Armatimonas sp.]
MPQLPLPPPSAIVGPRMPALSPDGKRLAFVWRGDIWLASTEGGDAKRITDNVEWDAYPVFSPDGNWIAFSSLRNGNWDIYLVPTNGGTPRQLTRSSGGEIVTGWSADGKRVLFSGQRDIPRPTLFSIDVQTGAFTKLTEDYMGLARPSYSPDGQKLVFERSGFPWTRPRYHGSAAAQLWTMDIPTGKRTLWPVTASSTSGHTTPPMAKRLSVSLQVRKPPATRYSASQSTTQTRLRRLRTSGASLQVAVNQPA